MDIVLKDQDLVTKILLKLEIKDLIQCLRVKKEWHRIIESKPFIGLHLEQTKKRYLLVKTGSRTGISDRFFFINEDFLISDKKQEETLICKQCLLKQDDEKGISEMMAMYNTIIGWSNGILCLYCYMDGSLTLWNPAINDAIAIPMLEVNSEKFIITTLYGFGFDADMNDYKVVGVQKMGNPLRNDYHAYSLSDGFWRRLAIADEEVVNGDMNIEGKGSTSTSGVYSWWLLDAQQNSKPPKILSILISTEEMVVTILPAAIRSGLPEHNNQLVNYHGRLGLINHVVDVNEHHIWVLGELGHEQSWTRLFKIRTLDPSESTELFVSTLIFNTTGPVITAFCKDKGVFLGRESDKTIGWGGYLSEGNTISQLIFIERETEQTRLVIDFGDYSIFQLCTSFNLTMIPPSHL